MLSNQLCAALRARICTQARNMIGLIWLGFLPIVFGQRAFTAKFTDCGNLSDKGFALFSKIFSGSILRIAPPILDGKPTGSVTITAPFNKRTGRHILGKVLFYSFLSHFNNSLNFQGKNVQICINGTVLENSVPQPVAGAALKNSAHGKVTQYSDDHLVTQISNIKLCNKKHYIFKVYIG